MEKNKSISKSKTICNIKKEIKSQVPFKINENQNPNLILESEIQSGKNTPSSNLSKTKFSLLKHSSQDLHSHKYSTRSGNLTSKNTNSESIKLKLLKKIEHQKENDLGGNQNSNDYNSLGKSKINYRSANTEKVKISNKNFGMIEGYAAITTSGLVR
jgi:hypothetical protein